MNTLLICILAFIILYIFLNYIKVLPEFKNATWYENIFYNSGFILLWITLIILLSPILIVTGICYLINKFIFKRK